MGPETLQFTILTIMHPLSVVGSWAGKREIEARGGRREARRGSLSRPLPIVLHALNIFFLNSFESQRENLRRRDVLE